MTPVHAIGGLLGAEADISGVGGLGAESQISTSRAAAPSGDFAGALGNAIGQLDGVQRDADHQQQLLATGQADDISSVVVSAERAKLALQLGTGVRNELVKAYNELLHTQL